MKGIYVIRSGAHCKVGVSHAPKQRLAELQPGSPLPLALEYASACGPMAYRLEAKAHEILSHSHTHREWFAVTPKEAVAAVLQAAKELGIELFDPPREREIVSKLLGLPAPLWRRVEDFKFANRIRTDNEALVTLLELGLDARDAKAKRKRQT